ncbi:MAG: hypothetical protein ACRDZ2_03520, partial [Ilumatobacteraceae bacterium]
PPPPVDLSRALHDLESQNHLLERTTEIIPQLRRELGRLTATEEAMRSELEQLRLELHGHSRWQLDAGELAQRLQTAESDAVVREALQRRIDDLEDSTSWRVTAPLRRISGVVLGR